MIVSLATSEFGEHLVIGGKSLYVLTTDSATTSSCDGECAKTWPPLLAFGSGDVDLSQGVSGAITIVTRDDGTKQAAIGGHPLYYFAGDSADGDVNGQGKGGVWFLAGPDGAPLAGEANGTPCGCTQAPPPQTPKSSDDGYGNYGT